MKKSILALALLSGVSASALAYQDNAQVLSSTPIYESVNQPRRECWNEQVGYSQVRDRNYGGALFGGLIGGVMGHGLGRGSGKDWATAVGAATGAILGDRADNADRVVTAEPHYEQHCRQVDSWTRRISGYNVTYRYQNQTYSTVMPYDPGPVVKVNVAVTPAN